MALAFQNGPKGQMQPVAAYSAGAHGFGGGPSGGHIVAEWWCASTTTTSFSLEYMVGRCCQRNKEKKRHPFSPHSRLLMLANDAPSWEGSPTGLLNRLLMKLYQMTRRKSTARKKHTHEMEAKTKWYMAYYPPFLSIQCPQNYPCCHCVIVFGEWFSKKKN